MASVLVVDDEVAMRNLMTRWVEMSGHQAASAASADEALDVIAQEPLAIALCDVRMPGRDGLWLAERIREEFPDIAVIVATGARDTDPRIAEHAGAVDYLWKPFGRDRLRFALERGFDWHNGAAGRREWGARLDFELSERQAELQARIGGFGAQNSTTLESLLALMEELDPDVVAHARRVAAMSVRMAEALGLQPDRIAAIRQGALLHDLGKLALPVAILSKPAALTREETDIVRRYPQIGAHLLGPIEGFGATSEIVGHAGEWFDGRGYPHALSGEAIPIGSRIVSAADAFDAMTRSRIYRDALPGSDAMHELVRCSSTQFDPTVVSALLEVLGERVER
jgi:response regulator RpfG family c-di-GMP phosphodiesterase